MLECLELRLLASSIAKGAGSASSSYSAAITEQSERVRNVYRRRLAVPLLDNEAARARFDAWEGTMAGLAGANGGASSGSKPSHAAGTDAGARSAVLTGFETAMRVASARRKLELRLKAARAAAGKPAGPWGAAAGGDDGCWGVWAEYLALEGDADPWRTRIVYERILGPGRRTLLSEAAAPYATRPGCGAATCASCAHTCRAAIFSPT